MARRDKNAALATKTHDSRSVKVARGGITNSREFTDLFSGLIADLAEQLVTASIANAMCNAGGKILKMVELEIRHGQQVPGATRRLLTISDGGNAGTPKPHRTPAALPAKEQQTA